MNHTPNHARLGLGIVTLAASVAAGCDDGSSRPSSFVPFDVANSTGVIAETRAAADMVTDSKAATAADADTVFADILATYQGNLTGQTYSLEDAIEGLDDPHSYGSATIGTYLDAQIEAAIALGAGAVTANPDAARDLVYAQQGIDKLPLVYFYLATYGGLSTRTRQGIDQAHGVYSFVPDDANTYFGLYASAVKREAAWSIVINDELEEHLIDARLRLSSLTTGNDDVAGADAQLDHAIEHADHQMLRVFAYGTRTYLEKLRDMPAAGPDKAMIEGRIFWVALRPWAEANYPTQATAVTTALYPTGEAAINDPGLHTAYGLGAYYNGTYDGQAAAGATAILAIIAGLESH